MARLLDIVFDLIMAVVVGRMLVGVFRNFLGSHANPSSGSGPSPGQDRGQQTIRGKTVRDPICGMFVSTELSHRLEWHGKLVHFCSQECLERFRKGAPA
jgi:YHS domain-containing protein